MQERAGFLAKPLCSICYVEAVRPATDDEIAAGVPTVEFAFRWPCFHEICQDCALRDAVEQGDASVPLEDLDLKCPICREPVAWPWSTSVPHVAASRGRGAGPSLLQSSTYRLPDERLLELITPERVRETNPVMPFQSDPPQHLSAHLHPPPRASVVCAGKTCHLEGSK